MVRSECISVGSGRTQRSEGGSDGVEGIERSERRKSGLSDEIAVDEVLQLFVCPLFLKITENENEKNSNLKQSTVNLIGIM